VGGVVVLGLFLGALAFIIIRRRRRRQIAPSAEYDSMHKNGLVGTPILSPPMNQTYMHSLDGTQYSPSSLPRPKLYDPSDPSTFPSPSPPPTVYTTQGDPQAGQPKTHPGQYSFVPEL
jgi:hypothetical protein